MDFLKNAFNRGLDIGLLGVKKGINFLRKLVGNHYENGKQVTSKNWNGNDKFVNSGNIQKRTVNRQKSNIMPVRAEVFGFLKETVNDNSVNPELVNASRILLENYDLLNDNCINDLYRGWTEYINNRDNQQLINELGKYIVDIASRAEREKVFSFLEQNKNKNDLGRDIIKNIHALLNDRDLIDKEAISSLYSAITSNNDTAITREITTAASRIKPRIVEIKLVKIVPKEDTDIEPSDDSVFHIAEAIIADAAKLDDKELRSNEKEFTANEIESELRSFVDSAELMFQNTPLGALDILKVKSTALKRVRTKVLATVCTNAFNEIKGSKDIKKCVNDLSNALIRYSKSEKFEDCKKIILIQEKLRKAIKNYKHIESVNEVLNKVFIRAAVDKFYKKFGDLSNPNTISGLKSIFNSLYEKIWDATKEKSLAINLNTHLKNLIYGFGFYPSSVDIGLKNLAGEDVGTTGVLSALKALSKEHALTIKNGKKFEVVNTGSLNDRNCAFRAISIGAGFGPNGYNIVQQKVVEGAQKLLEMWDGLDYGLRMQIAEMFIARVDTNDGKYYTLSDVKKLLKEYIACRGQGFVSGMQYIEYLFAAIGLGRPICVSNNENGTERTFLPNGRKEDGIDNNYFTYGSPIYIGRISGHAEALLPLDNKGSQKMANKLPELDKKASDMKDAISKHISGVIYEAMDEQSSLLKIIARDPRHIGESFIEAFLKAPRCKNDKNLFVAMKILAEVDSKLYADKRADAYNLEKEIRIIAKNKASGKLAPSQEEVLQNKLKQFGDIFADKAVELCKEEPLFWDNVKNSLFREW